MKKGWITGAVVVALSTILVACGSGDLSDNKNEIRVKNSERKEKSEQQAEEQEIKNEDSIPEIKTVADAREYMDKCLVNYFEYSELIRYEEEHIGKDYALDIKVSQIMEDGTLRGYDDSDGSGLYGGNEYMVVDKRVLDNTKIIENDTITVYGRYLGLEEIVRAIDSTTDAVPTFEMYLCDIGGVSVKATAEMADYSQYEEMLCQYPSEDCVYTLYDMDNDGVKELIITDETNWMTDIYTMDVGGIRGFESLACSMYLYASPDGNGLYTEYASMGEVIVQKVTVEKDELLVTENAEGDYTEADLLKQLPTSDFSLLQ